MTVRLAVVDDSSFVRKAIARLFVDDGRIEVVGSAASGEELLAKLHRWRPDVVTLDLSMPGMGGLQTLDRIMALRPIPVIILSTHAGEGAPQTIEALHRGAADFIDKQHYSLLDFDALREVLTEKILAVTGAAAEAGRPAAPTAARPAAAGAVTGRPFQALLLGASTGGPPAIEQVLRDLGVPCRLPIVVVQHMPAGFTSAFAHRLNAHLAAEVREAEHDGPLRAGTVSIAPAGRHLRIRRGLEGLRAILGTRPEAAHKPSIDELFLSAALEIGDAVIAVLLTGMGSDGARGLERLHQAGAYTIAQDEASSVVWGMPGAAVALGAATQCLALSRIGAHLRDLLPSG